MTERMTPHEHFADFQEHVPDHDCQGPGCEHPPSFYLLMHVAEDPVTGESAASIVSGQHAVDPDDVVEAFIRTIDRSFLNSRPEGMPAGVAWTYGRELIKRLAETMPAPGEVSSTIQDFIADMMKATSDDDE